MIKYNIFTINNYFLLTFDEVEYSYETAETIIDLYKKINEEYNNDTIEQTRNLEEIKMYQNIVK